MLQSIEEEKSCSLSMSGWNWTSLEWFRETFKRRSFFFWDWESSSPLVRSLLYDTRWPSQVVGAVLFHHVPELYGAITATCRTPQRQTTSVRPWQKEYNTCWVKTVIPPKTTDLWPGGWRLNQRPCWQQEQCELPSTSDCTEPASSSTASAAELG